MIWFEEDPWRIMKRIHDEVERGMSEAFKRMPEVKFAITPRADISETEDEVIVRIDAPGFKKEDFMIKATEDTLEVAAERKEEKEVKKESFYQRERRYGKFYRALTLPAEVKLEEAEAKYTDGVLEIRFKKAAPAKKKKKREIKVE